MNSIPHTDRIRKSHWLVFLLLILILILGRYFRSVGMNWDEGQHLHPDERFLTIVETDISPVTNVQDYFDTAHSSLNPHNRGHGFFVYGTLPIFIVRYLAEWVGQTGYDQVHLIGRQISGWLDLLSVILVYLIAARLYNRRVGLLAAAFYSFAVLPIQLSHYFTVDTFANFFGILAFYFAIRILKDSDENVPKFRWLFGGFGVAFGLALASKLSSAPFAVVLPAAAGIRLFSSDKEKIRRRMPDYMINLVLAGFVSLLVFRIFQPYAFDGPGFFDIKLNPNWVANIRELSAQSRGNVDFPPALQWARRPLSFSWVNMVLWGYGLPLGLLVWAGFFSMAWQTLKGSWKEHGLILGWTGLYFAWQALIWNRTMRYQMNVYPLLVILGAWLVVSLWDRSTLLSRQRQRILSKIVVIWIGAIALTGSLVWAYAFTRIYTRPMTRVEASRWIYQNFPGPINLEIETDGGVYHQPVPFTYQHILTPNQPYLSSFMPIMDGTLNSIQLRVALDPDKAPKNGNLRMALAQNPDGSGEIAESVGEIKSLKSGDHLAIRSVLLTFSPGLSIHAGVTVYFTLRLEAEDGELTLQGSALANESTWDDGLPLRLDGQDGFGGIYQGGLNFEMYWDDNQEKLDRFLNILNQADGILISSSRQWGTTTRVPERYPLASQYYRSLIGCPEEREIEWCYNHAKEGTFQGELGFDLVKVFQSDPAVDGFRINDQPSEEAFTVYDHPKVFIFRKSQAYNPEKARTILTSVDLTKVQHITPKQAGKPIKTLILPKARFDQQVSGGTWSEIYNPNSVINRSHILGTTLWYFVYFLLGLAAYPLIRVALPGLRDHGYALGRIAAVLLVSYLIWLSGSLGISIDRGFITLILGGFLAVSLLVYTKSRSAIRSEIQENFRQIWIAELLALVFFLFALSIRWGNADLWHPYKGGEKPMDFAYLNAVLKSSTFPPYDPWYAGGYINYYYFGFVLVGILVKWLGILPEFAYNLILPTIVSLVGLGAFTLGVNLFHLTDNGTEGRNKPLDPPVLRTGLFAATGVMILGNMGIWRMFFRGFQQLAANAGNIESAGILTKWFWGIKGFFLSLNGASLPYRVDEWYWNPSRVIPALNDTEPINEFPFFTFTYADLHAHLIALPLTLLILAWIVSLIRNNNGWTSWKSGLSTLFLGSLAIGSLKVTNTWDFPTYLGLCLVGIVYAAFFKISVPELPLLKQIPYSLRKVLWIGVLIGVFALLAYVLYLPFSVWYAQGYTKIDLWNGTTTPTNAFFTHWGLFLFVIISWLAWETRNWLAATPMSSLKKLAPYKTTIQAILLSLIALIIFLQMTGIYISWLVIPLILWTGLLIIRPAIPDSKRMVLMMMGTGFTLTLIVEMIVLRGDIGRMNTVFKFYYQAWTLLGISAAVSLGWLLQGLRHWVPGIRKAWQIGLVILLLFASLFPVLGALAKIKDRISPQTPRSLDGMDFMQYATYNDQGTVLELVLDYDAIQWMRANIPGSPVIVEGNTPEYRWGSRYSIYTGLPSVVGWNWHQRQQRAFIPTNEVERRIADVRQFYEITAGDDGMGFVKEFINQYQVEYIVLGQLEKANYAPAGVAKFALWDGLLWNTVYQNLGTTIYQVIR